MRYPDGTAPPRKEGNIKIMDYFFEYVGKVRSQSLVEISKKTNTPSVRKYLSSKWIKGNVSRCILVLDTSLFIHFDDKYFRTEGVENRVGDDGVRAILQYRPSDLYLTDRKETMSILQKYTHTPLHVHKYGLPSFILFSHKINYSYKCILMFRATHVHLASFF